jgi:hypothetical protein
MTELSAVAFIPQCPECERITPAIRKESGRALENYHYPVRTRPLANQIDRTQELDTPLRPHLLELPYSTAARFLLGIELRLSRANWKTFWPGRALSPMTGADLRSADRLQNAPAGGE